MHALWNWLDHRTGLGEVLQHALYEPIPGGAKWRYVWGSTLVFVFVLQMITGICLWSAYSPSTTTAWESVYYIQHQMEFGWLIRGIHHFAAQAMMVLLALHFMQVVIGGAYRAPREVNFWLGLVLMQIVLGLSLTGYLLPWDQKGYYATQVATKIMGATPVIGPQVQELVQGGPQYGHHTLTRFFALHAGLLPALLIGFLALHIAVFRRHGIHTPDPKAAPGMFWPDQVLKDAVACLVVLATILALTVFRGAELSGPADVAEAYQAARPEWYFLFLFQFLKFEAVEQQGLAFGALYVPGAIMGVIALMPLVGRWKLGHGFNVAFLLALMLGVGYLTGLAFLNDRRDPEFVGHVAAAEREGHRAVELAKEHGIPPTGVLTLLQQDPAIQGPRLFAKHCKGCHRYNGHDGTLRPVLRHVAGEGHGGATLVPDDATAPDLGDFGGRDWVKRVLVDYATVFAPTAKGRTEEGELGDRFVKGEMADWSSQNREVLLQDANQRSLQALVEFVVAQAGTKVEPPIDAELAQVGQEIFTSGKLLEGALTSACSDCHGMTTAAGTVLAENTGTAPTLTGYGGPTWLRGMISTPGDAAWYGDRNAMPAFANKLSPRDLELLVKWMTHDQQLTP